VTRPGTVKWFSDRRGYGFIEQAAGPDVYVHHSAIQMEGYRTLKPGMTVTFEMDDAVPAPRARRVTLVLPAADLERNAKSSR
jgi:CspA family cold shock protein